jgi:DNA polymerase-3 subunit delta'
VLSTIVGHRRLLALLSRAIAHGTLPPSLLLAGPAGVGKRRTATAIAQTLNCLSPVVSAPLFEMDGDDEALPIERDACGTCASCRRIERGVHPDVIVLEPGDTGAIKIAQVREAIDQSGYRPFEGRRRVIIIDDAAAMVHEAQSALLKTLEEPPSASIFLLVSAMPDSLLPTVRSRCPRLRFGALPAGEVAAALMRDHGYSEAEAFAAAADADGSIGLALAARSADVAEARESAQRLLEEAARLGDPSRRLDVARELTSGKGTPAAERDRLAACLRAAASLLRDLGLIAEGADERVLANADVRAHLAALSQVYDSKRSSKAYAAVDEALLALERNASPKIVANWLVLQL